MPRPRGGRRRAAGVGQAAAAGGWFAEKIEEWVDRLRGRIGADVAHERLVAMGYLGSERTTRRAVAATKRAWRAEHGRRTRPRVTEPGFWMQWDYGDGPAPEGAAGQATDSWVAFDQRFRVDAVVREEAPRALAPDDQRS